VVLSWIVPSVNFVLQQNSGLGVTNWTDVTTVPTLNYGNLRYQVPVPASAASMLYHLVLRQ